MPKLIFIVGQTAVGKTELALRIAEELNTSVLSCDSLCFYKGMNIGTAKPTIEEQARIPHFGIDLVPVHLPYSIGEYVDYTRLLLSRFNKSGEDLVVVGGSGFYLKSFFEPVIDDIPTSDALLSLVQRWHKEGGLDRWVVKLKELNPGDPLEIDLQNPRRVGKALVRCLATGKSISELKARFDGLPKPFIDWNKKVILLDRDEDEMKIRNHNRINKMLDDGLVEEVQQLLDEGIESNPSAAKSIGYKETIQFIRGEISLPEMIEQIGIHTNQLMRKQRAWFRHQIPIDLHLDAKVALERPLNELITP